MNPILSSRQAAALLGINRATVVRWVRSGVLPGRIEGVKKRVRVQRADVMKLRDSWNVAPQPDFKSMAANDQD
jgi:excisionase family DNA binding protein